MFLNFGYIFGYVIECYYDFVIKYGVVISYGMLISLELGIKVKIILVYFFNDVKNILLRLEFVKEFLLDKK